MTFRRRNKVMLGCLLILALSILSIGAIPLLAGNASDVYQVHKQRTPTATPSVTVAIVNEKAIGNYADIVHFTVDRTHLVPAATILPEAPARSIDHVPIGGT